MLETANLCSWRIYSIGTGVCILSIEVLSSVICGQALSFQPRSNGLQANSEGLQPNSFQPRSNVLSNTILTVQQRAGEHPLCGILPSSLADIAEIENNFSVDRAACVAEAGTLLATGAEDGNMSVFGSSLRQRYNGILVFSQFHQFRFFTKFWPRYCRWQLQARHAGGRQASFSCESKLFRWRHMSPRAQIGLWVFLQWFLSLWRQSVQLCRSLCRLCDSSRLPSHQVQRQCLKLARSVMFSTIPTMIYRLTAESFLFPKAAPKSTWESGQAIIPWTGGPVNMLPGPKKRLGHEVKGHSAFVSGAR